MYRNTYVEVNLSNLEHNVRSLIERYKDYDYHLAVVKADCYAHNDISTIKVHNDISTVKTIINAGCNYLAVATLDEALIIREQIKDIPILCLGIIDPEYLPMCVEKNVDVTVGSLDYLKSVDIESAELKVHIKVNTGMNRLGVNSKEEFNEVYRLIGEKGFVLEGVYTHIYNAPDEKDTMAQYDRFELITGDIDLSRVPIVHVGASEATEFYDKRPYANGCRLGISMYGLIDCGDIEFKPTFCLFSEVIQINEVENGVVGYSGAYRVGAKERIAVVPIGYADGINRRNTGREVYINDKAYKIVGNVCMDMLFVKVDDSVKMGDKVAVIRDIEHIKQIAKHLDTITYEIICSITKRVPRVYVK